MCHASKICFLKSLLFISLNFLLPKIKHGSGKLIWIIHSKCWIINHIVIQHSIQNCINFHLGKLWYHFSDKDFWCLLCAFRFTYSLSHTTSLSGWLWLIWYRKHLYMAGPLAVYVHVWHSREKGQALYTASSRYVLFSPKAEATVLETWSRLAKINHSCDSGNEARILFALSKSLNKIISEGNECLGHSESSSWLCIVTQFYIYKKKFIYIILTYSLKCLDNPSYN